MCWNTDSFLDIWVSVGPVLPKLIFADCSRCFTSSNFLVNKYERIWKRDKKLFFLKCSIILVLQCDNSYFC